MYKNKRVGVVGVIITIVILITLVVLTNIKMNSFSSLEGFFGKLIMPIQNGITKLKNKLAKNDSFFEDIGKLKEENEKLQNENNRLKEELKGLEIIKAENATLRSYNDMSEQYKEFKTIPGYIINRDISNLSSTIVINIGTNDGVGVDMPVISTGGLVGHVISVTDKTAKVEPIIDAAGSTSAQFSTTRECVIAKGLLRKQ